MMMRNGIRAIALGSWAWLLSVGLLGAQTVTWDASPAAWVDPLEAPVEECQHCCKAWVEGCAKGCAECSNTDACEVFSPSALTWAPAQLDLVWFEAANEPLLTQNCQSCPLSACQHWCLGEGGFGCSSPLGLACGKATAAAVFSESDEYPAPPSLEPGEPAEVLLEIRNLLGTNPLQGTAYQTVDMTGQINAQSAFVEGVRDSVAGLEAVCPGACVAAASACACPADGETVVACDSAVPAAGPSHDARLIPLLRHVGRQLEEAANMLEDGELYFRADQMRELAKELRIEARSAGGSWSLEPLGQVSKAAAPEPQRDLARENEELRAELERLRESLRAGIPADDVLSR